MFANLCQGIAYIRVGAQQIMVFVGFPFLERRKFLRYRGEETNDDTDRCGLHVVAEFADNLLILSIISGVNEKHTESLQESDSDSQIASPPIRQVRLRRP